ncbi:MAG: hypothetical protein JSW26_21840 [Desulfobacterales bacterium]|nr:MAG: hypothetical protein JSW26_21840 [Desulfobacterales bacterium]
MRAIDIMGGLGFQAASVAKGTGMIRQDMAIMLSFLMTDIQAFLEILKRFVIRV